MIRKYKLTPKQVKAYEEMSGFKTNGDVEIQTDDEAFEIYMRLLEPNPPKTVDEQP